MEKIKYLPASKILVVIKLSQICFMPVKFLFDTIIFTLEIFLLFLLNKGLKWKLYYLSLVV